jgi:polar amino acid transport system substrate-binding protein
MNTWVRWKSLLIGAAVAAAPVLTFADTQKPTLVMVGDNWCPYNCAPDAAQRGYMVDILERVLGAKFNLKYLLEPWTRAIKMVESGEAQLLIATPATTAQKIIASVPFGVDQSCFFVRKTNPWRYSKLDDLKSMRLGVVQDYSYDDNGPLDAMIAGFRKRGDPLLETAVGENALESNFRKLKAGRMDVVVENDNVGRYMIQELKLQEYIAFANCATHHIATTHVAVSSGRPDAPQILAAINSGLAELRRSGELNTILKRYGLSDWQSAKTKKPSQ